MRFSSVQLFKFWPIHLCFASIFLFACSKGKTGGTTPPTPPRPTPVWDPNAVRGAWITTAASTALDSRDNVKAMVTNCKNAGINNIYVVVYNNARTIYPSNVMHSLIGVRQLERYAGRDPLQECIDEA